MADEREPVPPTVLRASADDVPPTVVRGAEDVVPPTVIRAQDAQAEAGEQGREHFPEGLRVGYEPVAIAGSGTEAEVWHARRRRDGRDVAVKVHRPGSPIDEDLLRHLDSPRFHRHVPELHEFGYTSTTQGRAGWVAMEYLPATLDRLMSAERGPDGLIPADRATEILAELAATIRFWQDPDELDRTPIDVKPDNFGVRRSAPLELVVIDFGGVVRQTTTQRYGDIAAARAYMSPEGIIGMRHKASPWWSLGVLAYELATGTSRFRAPDGRLLDDRVLLSETVLADADLSDATDDRWRLLLTGLLTRNPDDRWGADQVSSWLAGGSPPVARLAVPEPGPAKARAPITFRHRSYWSPADLATALADHPDIAASWLQTDAGELSRWVQQDVADNLFDTRKYLTGIAARPARAPLAILAFGAAYARDRTPRYRATPVDAAGVAALSAMRTAGAELLTELFEHEALSVAAQYDCPHPQCQAGQRCLILDHFAEEVPRIMSLAGQSVSTALATAAGQAANPRTLTTAERQLAMTTAVQLTVGVARDQASRIRREVGPPLRSDPAWWAEVAQRAAGANPLTIEGRADLTAAIALHGRIDNERTRLRLEARDRLHRQVASVRHAPIIAPCAFIALTLLNWSATIAGFAIREDDHQLLSTAPQQAFLAHEFSRVAAGRVLDLLPLLAITALVSALPRIGRGALACGAIVLTGAGFAATRTPVFPAPIAPAFARNLLASVAASLHQLTGITAVFIAPAVAIVALIIAVRLAQAQDTALPARRARLGRLPAGVRHLLAAVITFIVLETILGAGLAIRTAITDPSLPALASSVAASYQSGLLLACAAVAIIAALPRSPGARGVLVTGAIAATAVSIWYLHGKLFEVLWHPVARPLFVSLASLWGTEAFWAAVVLGIPIIVTGFALSARLRNF